MPNPLFPTALLLLAAPAAVPPRDGVVLAQLVIRQRIIIRVPAESDAGLHVVRRPRHDPRQFGARLPELSVQEAQGQALTPAPSQRLP